MAQILIADHDRDYRELVIFALRFTGHITNGVSSAEECLALAEKLKPDLILLEYELPNAGGVDTCLKLKAEDTTALIPVLFLVTSEVIAQTNEAFGECGVGYILKSISPDKLTRKVNAVIKNKLTA